MREPEQVLAFLDQWEVSPGDNLLQYMKQGIENSKYAIFVCSQKAVSSANNKSGMIGYEAELLESIGIKEKKIKIIPIQKIFIERILLSKSNPCCINL